MHECNQFYGVTRLNIFQRGLRAITLLASELPISDNIRLHTG